MAKKKKRRRPSGSHPPGAAAVQSTPASQQPKARPQTPAGRSGATEVRRERKEEARLARQAALRRMQRQRLARRTIVWGGGAVLVVGAFLFLTRSPSHDINEALVRRANAAAETAGCTDIQTPPDKGREHIQEGADFSYDQQPPTSGNHDPIPLPAGIYTAPQSETNLVHSLEHGAVEIYYESSGSAALPDTTVNALAGVVQGKSKVILTPAPETLDPPLNGDQFTTSVAFAAWDRLRQCPGDMSADDAKLIARGFINEFVDAPSAPERGRPI